MLLVPASAAFVANTGARERARSTLPFLFVSLVFAAIIGLLRYLDATAGALPHWQADVKATQLLLGAVENDAM